LLVNGTAPASKKYDMSGKTIILDADIILNDTTEWNNWDNNAPEKINNWTPIGRSSASSAYDTPFKGTFDGNGHLVIGVYSKNTNSNSNQVGLFGFVSAETAVIKNVGVVASYVSGKEVGLVVGYIWGTISDSYSRGIVKTNNGDAGGLVGLGSAVTIKNCYSTSTVMNINDVADNRMGGLLGIAYGNTKIVSSYSTSKVVKVGTYGNSGGLVGYILGNQATITDGYYDKDTSGQTDSNKGTPMTTVDMQDQNFATLLGDAFKHNPGGYPLLAWQ